MYVNSIQDSLVTNYEFGQLKLHFLIQIEIPYIYNIQPEAD